MDLARTAEVRRAEVNCKVPRSSNKVILPTISWRGSGIVPMCKTSPPTIPQPHNAAHCLFHEHRRRLIWGPHLDRPVIADGRKHVAPIRGHINAHDLALMASQSLKTRKCLPGPDLHRGGSVTDGFGFQLWIPGSGGYQYIPVIENGASGRASGRATLAFTKQSKEPLTM